MTCPYLSLLRPLSVMFYSQPDDLTFQKNDIIIITQKENEHWYRGYVQSDPSARAGLFPSNVGPLFIIHLGCILILLHAPCHSTWSLTGLTSLGYTLLIHTRTMPQALSAVSQRRLLCNHIKCTNNLQRHITILLLRNSITNQRQLLRLLRPLNRPKSTSSKCLDRAMAWAIR